MMFSPAPSGLSDVGWDVAAVAVLNGNLVGN